MTLMLAVAGPATGLPRLLASGLLGFALVALCRRVPLPVAAGLAVGAGLGVELAYVTSGAAPDLLGGSARVVLLVLIALVALVTWRIVALPRRLTSARSGSATTPE